MRWWNRLPGVNLGGRLLDWAGDRAWRAGAGWVRLDAWTSNERLHRYYLGQGFAHVRTVLEGAPDQGGDGGLVTFVGDAFGA
ncbi:hypothetical protein [Streptomyces sp. GSL17-111]|uniref:hypothetical protein n=1 Tax=Streptomyces sp. GSL17-111 TaxID=3121596 RepID=UPI0030F4A3A7